MCVLLPELKTEVCDFLSENSGKPIVTRPLFETHFELSEIVFLGMEDLVQQRALSNDCKVR